MKKTLHKANTRGRANHGWLQSFHTFSFANYYQAERMNFGVLRVLNDDTVSGGMGFGKHPHENMEIVSIPLEGELEHKDSMGNTTIIQEGEVQIMSAGTGIYHSEKNKNSQEFVKFLQIWILPKERNITPRYDQKKFDKNERNSTFQTVVSPIGTGDGGVEINQDAWFSMITLGQGDSISYDLKKEGNGMYIFVLKGSVLVANELLETRDGLGISDMNSVTFESKSNTEILMMDVPMLVSE